MTQPRNAIDGIIVHPAQICRNGQLKRIRFFECQIRICLFFPFPHIFERQQKWVIGIVITSIFQGCTQIIRFHGVVFQRLIECICTINHNARGQVIRFNGRCGVLIRGIQCWVSCNGTHEMRGIGKLCVSLSN